MKIFSTLFNLNFLFVFICFSAFGNSFSQTINFADGVVNFSSQWSSPSWAATQATAFPNTYPANGDILTAWASSSADGQREFLELSFTNPMPIDSIVIYETYNAGAIDTIFVKNPISMLWESVYTATASALPGSQILSVSFPMTSFSVSEIRIAVNSPAISTWNEIDAVAIINSTPNQLTICSGDSILINGNYESTAGNYMDTNYVDFDVDLTSLFVLNATSSTQTISACNSYISPSGLYTWTSSNTYLDTIPNTNGCDSIITFNLTINTVDASATQPSGNMLSATATGASYQWLDCNNSYATIPGETNQDFLPVANGDYAVEVTANGCTDTSACLPFGYWGMVENELNFKVYPNPASENFVIEINEPYEHLNVQINSGTGSIVFVETFNGDTKIKINENLSPGIYFLTLQIDSADPTIVRLIKQ